jgi:hypothetical protein
VPRLVRKKRLLAGRRVSGNNFSALNLSPPSPVELLDALVRIGAKEGKGRMASGPSEG